MFLLFHNFCKGNAPQTSMSTTATSLHYLIQNHQWNEAATKLKMEPEVVILSRFGYLPLHLACEVGGPPELIEALISEYPSSIHSKTFCARTPLDLAKLSYPVDNHHFHAVLKLLVDAENAACSRAFPPPNTKCTLNCRWWTRAAWQW